jgi:hypothetical protein
MKAMTYLAIAAVTAGFALSPVTGEAQPAKKIHRARQVVPAAPVYDPRIVPVTPDMSGGNAAAGGNNANSMSGSNSAAENANGRTSGGGHGG